MTKKKKIIAIVVPISIVVIIAVTILSVFLILKRDSIDPTPQNFQFDSLGSRPNQSLLAGTTQLDPNEVAEFAFSETPTNDPAVIKTAVYLLNVANQNLHDVNYYASYAIGSGTATIPDMSLQGDMHVREVRIKEGNKMYMESLGQVTKGYKKDQPDKPESFYTGLCGALLDYGKRLYVNGDIDQVSVQQGKNSILNPNSLNNFYKTDDYIAFDKIKKTEKYTVEEFMKNDSYNISYAEAFNTYIREDTVLEASVVKMGEGKNVSYKVSVKIDKDSDALTLATEAIRKSASSTTIVYTHQTVNAEIWDSGMFRWYNTEDGWAGTLLDLLTGSSVNTWMKYFVYDKAACERMVLHDLEWTK